jgi:hypothetical protein
MYAHSPWIVPQTHWQDAEKVAHRQKGVLQGLKPSVAEVDMTLPSECVSLRWLVLGDVLHPRRSRGGGNVGIGLIDFQGLWEGRKTVSSFSGLSTNRHFHSLLQ